MCAHERRNSSPGGNRRPLQTVPVVVPNGRFIEMDIATNGRTTVGLDSVTMTTVSRVFRGSDDRTQKGEKSESTCTQCARQRKFICIPYTICLRLHEPYIYSIGSSRLVGQKTWRRNDIIASGSGYASQYI